MYVYKDMTKELEEGETLTPKQIEQLIESGNLFRGVIDLRFYQVVTKDYLSELLREKVYVSFIHNNRIEITPEAFSPIYYIYPLNDEILEYCKYRPIPPHHH